MRAVVQRVASANVTVDNQTIAQIEQGFLILLGVTHSDTTKEAETLANKIARLRVFRDENDKMNRSLQDIDGHALVVSQFTLYGDTKKGNRPSFINAAPPEQANTLYQHFTNTLKQNNIPTQTGSFGANMQVHLTNNGPVTILLDTDD